MEIRTYKPDTHRVRMLVYGSSGVGKTVFCATAPKPLFLAVEEGLLSLSDKNAQYVRIRTLQDMRDIVSALKANKILDAKGKPMDYETIVIDSLTELQQVIIIGLTGGKRPSRDQWSDFGDRMAEVLRSFLDLDKHVIFTCLESEKSDEDEDGREFSRFQPELFGKLAQKTMAMMDFVGRYYIKTEVVADRPQSKRVLTFSFSPRWAAKDRSAKLPQFADPDFTKLMTEFVKIKIGEGKLLGTVDSGMAAPKLTFPPEPKDTICTKEQQAEIKEAWRKYMTLFRNPQGLPIPTKKHDAYLLRTMKEHTGADTTTKLRKKQADQFFGLLLDKIKELEKTSDTPAAAAEASPQSPMQS